MAPQVKPKSSFGHRLRSPNVPLVIRAKEVKPASDSDTSSFHTIDSGSRYSPEAEVATLLEREHRVNRIQAKELQELRDQVHLLRRAAEGSPSKDPNNNSPRRHQRKNASHEIVQLIAENHDLQERIAEQRKALEVRDRQIVELESQLHDMSDRLHSALESLKNKTNSEDNYILPATAFNPLQSATDAFQNMNTAELNEANMALSHYLAKSRARVHSSTAMYTSDYESVRTSPKRPASPFPTMRPQSVQTVMPLQSTAGAYNHPPSSSASESFPSSTDSFYRNSRRAVKWAGDDSDADGKGKWKHLGRGKFSVSNFFKK